MDNENSFYLIFKKLTNNTQYNLFIWFNLHYINYGDVFNMSSDTCCFKKKFKCIQQLRHDIFVTPEFYNKIMDYVCLSQKIYWAFSRMAYKYKLRKATLKLDTDLYLNPINPKSPYAIDIYQERFIYRFTLQNLVHYIEGAIANTQGFISVPLICKNPYNNIPFSNATLYEIYFRVKSSDLILPDLFHRFFLCSFNLELFVLENESLIRERAILRHLNTSSPSTIYEEIVHMFDIFPFFKIKISNKFPKDELVHIMKPYLYLFFLHKYSINNPEIKNRAYYFLKMKLSELAKYNPRFGKKRMIKQIGNGFGLKTIYVKSFNKDHPKFTMNMIRNANYKIKNMYTSQYYHDYFGDDDTTSSDEGITHVNSNDHNVNSDNEESVFDTEDEMDESNDDLTHDGNTVVHETNNNSNNTNDAYTSNISIISSDDDNVDEDEVEDYNDF